MKDIKILHLIDKMGQGGAQTIVRGMISHSKNTQQYLYSLTDDSTCSPLKKFDILRMFYTIKILKQNNISVLHAHLLKSTIISILLKITLFPNLILIIHDHGAFQIHEDQSLMESIAARLAIKLLNFFNSDVDQIITISNYLQEELTNQISIQPGKIVILPNFLSIEPLSIQPKSNTLKAEFTFGFAGRIENAKGIFELVFAFAKLIKEGYKVRLRIAGNGSQIEKVRNLIVKLNLTPHVDILGYVKNIKSFFSTIDCLVMPSKIEGMGLTHLEAQSQGIPVICSDVGGMAETVDNQNAYILEENKIPHLKKMMESVMKNKEIRKLKIKNGLSNAKKYQIDDYMIKYIKIIRSIYVADSIN